MNTKLIAILAVAIVVASIFLVYYYKGDYGFSWAEKDNIKNCKAGSYVWVNDMYGISGLWIIKKDNDVCVMKIYSADDVSGNMMLCRISLPMASADFTPNYFTNQDVKGNCIEDHPFFINNDSFFPGDTMTVLLLEYDGPITLDIGKSSFNPVLRVIHPDMSQMPDCLLLSNEVDRKNCNKLLDSGYEIIRIDLVVPTNITPDKYNVFVRSEFFDAIIGSKKISILDVP